MPIYDTSERKNLRLPHNQLPDNIIVDDEPNKVAPEAASTLELFKAGFREQNEVASYLTSREIDTDKDPNFDPVAELEARDLWDYGPLLIDSESLTEFNSRIDQADRELETTQMLNEGGLTGLAARITGTLASPLTLVPVVGQLGSIYRGVRVAKGAFQGALLTSGAIAAQEGLLHSTQLTRNEEESYRAIVGGALLGAGLGGAVGAISRPAAEATKDIILDMSKGKQPAYKLEGNKITADRKSVGAAERDYIKENWEYDPKNISKGTLKAASIFRSPLIRGLNSKFAEIKNFTSRMFEHNFITNLNEAGGTLGPALESRINRASQNIQTQNRLINDEYVKYTRTGGIFKGARASIKGSLDSKLMSPSEFSAEVEKASRRGGVHEVPEVANAAKQTMKMIEDATKVLKEAGILTDEMIESTAKTNISSYFPRRYNKKLIRGNRAVFIAHIEKGLKEANPNIDSDEIQDAALKAYDSIMGMSDAGTIHDLLIKQFVDGSSKPGFLKDRTISLSDEYLEPWLLNDGPAHATTYAIQAHSLANFQKMLNEMGFDSIKDFKVGLAESLERNAGKIKATEEELIQAQSFVDEMTDLFLGFRSKRGDFDDALYALKKYQVLTLMGGLTASSLPDLIMPAFRHGLGRAMKTGYIPMLKSIKANKQLKEEWDHLIVGLNATQSDILTRLADPEDVHRIGRRSKVSQAFDVATDAFMKSVGFSHLMSIGRTLALRTTTSRILEGITKGTDIPYLRSLGISDINQDIISTMFKKHGTLEGRGHIANQHKWAPTDKISSEDLDSAIEAFETAVIRDINSTNILPSKGDIPVKAQTDPLMGVVFQFKSFAASATNKILLSSLNRKDKDALIGITMLISMGALVGVIKDILAGRDVSLDPDKLLIDGITRSGFGGFVTDVPLGLLGQGSRFADRNALGMLVGPSFGQAADLVGLANSALKGQKLSKKDMRTIRRSIILQNHIAIQTALATVGAINDD